MLRTIRSSPCNQSLGADPETLGCFRPESALLDGAQVRIQSALGNAKPVSDSDPFEAATDVKTWYLQLPAHSSIAFPPSVSPGIVLVETVLSSRSHTVLKYSGFWSTTFT